MNQYKNQYIIWLVLVGLVNIFFLKLPIVHIVVSMVLAAIALYTFLSKDLNVKLFSLLLDSILMALVVDAIWIMKTTNYRGLAIIFVLLASRLSEGYLIKKSKIISKGE